MTFDNGDAQLLNKCSDNNEASKKICLNAIKEEIVLPDSKGHTSKIKNSTSFEKGDNVKKTTKMLAEKIETTTRAEDQLSIRSIKSKLKAKSKCIDDIVQATSNYVDTLFEAVINSVNITSICTNACCDSEQSLLCSENKLSPEYKFKNNMNGCLKSSMDNLINKKIFDQNNIEVNSVELKAKCFNDSTSTKTEVAKACNIAENFNDKTLNDNKVNKDLNIFAE